MTPERAAALRASKLAAAELASRREDSERFDRQELAERVRERDERGPLPHSLALHDDEGWRR